MITAATHPMIVQPVKRFTQNTTRRRDGEHRSHKIKVGKKYAPRADPKTTATSSIPPSVVIKLTRSI